MQRHWARCGPPAYIALALYLGLTKPPARAGERCDDPDSLAHFLQSAPWGLAARA